MILVFRIIREQSCLITRLPVTDSMGDLTAKKDQSLSGWDIRFLVPFWPEPEPEPDIRYIPNLISLFGDNYFIHACGLHKITYFVS